MRGSLLASGLATIVTGFFGGQSANTAGMMSTITADKEAGIKKNRYVASIISGVLILLFGLFSWKIVPIVLSLPKQFIAMVAGFALLSPLCSSAGIAFSNSKHRFSSVVSFMIALSNISFLHISAPLWSLIFGFAIAKTIEGKDSKKQEWKAKRNEDKVDNRN